MTPPISGVLHCVAQSSMAVVTLKSSVRERKIPCDRAQMEMFSYWRKVNGKRGKERGETSLLGQEWQKRRDEKRKRNRDRGEKREMGDGSDAFGRNIVNVHRRYS